MSNYIMDLRKYVGHNPLLQCGASVIIENPDNEILLQLRTDNNCWDYSGGAIELGETVEEAAKRELFEETGLIADKLELFTVFSGKDAYYKYPNGDEVYNIDIVFTCREYHGKLKRDDSEVKELRFFSLNNLPENISPPVIVPLQKYVNLRKEQLNMM